MTQKRKPDIIDAEFTEVKPRARRPLTTEQQAKLNKLRQQERLQQRIREELQELHAREQRRNTVDLSAMWGEYGGTALAVPVMLVGVGLTALGTIYGLSALAVAFVDLLKAALYGGVGIFLMIKAKGWMER